MSHPQYIYNLKDKKIPLNIGAKAKNLRFLMKKKFQIPETYVCIWDAHLHYLKNKSRINDLIRKELFQSINVNKRYAVRSSANIEDGNVYSFAGQFKSKLNVKGIDPIVEAIESIWSSAYAEGVRTYLKKIGVDPDEVKMAVIIQEMVVQHVSGVSFSKNPLTGMDEIIVEATEGNGENILQNGITPERWVNKWGNWVEKPDSPSIDPSVIQKVISKTRDIVNTYGNDVDVEWVFDGKTIHWVQMREITSLNNSALYSNHFAREVFPGIIKPLVWSINVPLVCGAWVKLFAELIGRSDIDPNKLAKSFYYQAYFNMGTIGKIFKSLGFPPNTLELLMGIELEGSEKPSFKPTGKTLMLLPRMLLCTINKVRFAKKIDAFLPFMQNRYQDLPADQLEEMNEKELIQNIQKLYALNEETAYYMIVTYLLMGLYNGILKFQLKKLDVDFEKFDLTSGMDELAQFDPTSTLEELSLQFNQLDEIAKKKIKNGSYRSFLRLKGIRGFKRGVTRFITHFGHLSDSGNDFSSVPWREDPDAILKMIASYTGRKDKVTSKLNFDELGLSVLPRLLLTPLYNRARRFRLYREEVGFLYTYGYGLFRRYFLALGDLLVRRKMITNREDIFYLYVNEVNRIVRENERSSTCADVIARRKREMINCKGVVLPHTIYGDQPPPLVTDTAKMLKGIPTSKGLYKGPVKVIQGLSDFQKLREGDVLVIPFSDVGWTPLFSKAGAIIAESGGFLSHSSIIAREYEIPAIVSVPGACYLEDNTMVTVDGYRGTVILGQSRLLWKNPEKLRENNRVSASRTIF